MVITYISITVSLMCFYCFIRDFYKFPRVWFDLDKLGSSLVGTLWFNDFLHAYGPVLVGSAYNVDALLRLVHAPSVDGVDCGAGNARLGRYLID